MIGIIKYQAGNIASVSNALDRLGAEYIVTDNREELDKTSAVILPGVGHAGAAMDDLRARDLDIWIKKNQEALFRNLPGNAGYVRFIRRRRQQNTWLDTGSAQKI